MNDPQDSAFVALFLGTGLALVLAVPYIAWSYRRRGELGIGHAALAFVFLVYGFAVWTYTLLPTPSTTAQWCSANAADTAQLRPFRFIADFHTERVGRGVRGVLANPAFQQTALNVVLFVPLGMFGRHLLRGRPATVVAAGFLTSLAVEITQRTAVFGIFACPYRLFDVDDLMTNTTGAAIGVLLAPLLRYVPGQRTSGPAGAPRPVTARRRLLAVLLDGGAVIVLGSALQVSANAVAYFGAFRLEDVRDVMWLVGTFPSAVVLLLLVALVGDGATPGQRLVLLKPVDAAGRAPAAWQRWARFATGAGGYFLLVEVEAWDWSAPVASTAFLAVGVLALVATPGHRGLSGLVSASHVVDTRAVPAPAPDPRHELRSTA